MLLPTDGKAARRPHIAHMNNHTLTADQRRFAEQHHATAATYCADNHAICLYDNQPYQTIRWIVNDRGRLLETTAFARAA
jgi:hypothetical protein